MSTIFDTEFYPTPLNVVYKMLGNLQKQRADTSQRLPLLIKKCLFIWVLISLSKPYLYKDSGH